MHTFIAAASFACTSLITLASPFGLPRVDLDIDRADGRVAFHIHAYRDDGGMTDADGGAVVPGSLAVLVIAPSGALAPLPGSATQLLADGIVAGFGALDGQGAAAFRFPEVAFGSGLAWHCQGIVLADGALLASDPKPFRGMGDPTARR
jgi:hypothetical protein